MKRFLKTPFGTFTLLFILYMLIALIGKFSGPNEAEMEMQNYCEMVHLNLTNPADDVGWPDYKGIYDKVCNGPTWNGE